VISQKTEFILELHVMFKEFVCECMLWKNKNSEKKDDALLLSNFLEV
jgi:hypothetical protein